MSSLSNFDSIITRLVRLVVENDGKLNSDDTIISEITKMSLDPQTLIKVSKLLNHAGNICDKAYSKSISTSVSTPVTKPVSTPVTKPVSTMTFTPVSTHVTKQVSRAVSKFDMYPNVSFESKLPLNSIEDIYIPNTYGPFLNALSQAHYGKSGLVSAQVAIREIQNGRKQNHWMWYMFPALDEIRGKGTQHKEFLLKDFGATCAFLIDTKDSPIYNNLITITNEVNRKLKEGKIASTIFSTDHDAEKFYQAVSLYYLASQIISLFKDEKSKSIYMETTEIFGNSLKLLGRGIHGWTFKIANDWINANCKLFAVKEVRTLSPWYCNKCTHHNKATKMRCDACYAYRSTH